MRKCWEIVKKGCCRWLGGEIEKGVVSIADTFFPHVPSRMPKYLGQYLLQHWLKKFIERYRIQGNW